MVTNGFDVLISQGNNQLIIALVFLAILGVTLVALFETRKSKKYRRYLTDMYVSAKIRFFAKEDGLDLEAEAVNFKDWIKTNSIKNKPLDEVVEDELIERVGLDDKIKKRIEKKVSKKFAKKTKKK